MITLTYSGTTVTLPEDLYWSDENSWHPVEQTVEPTITGAVIVQSAQRLTGRPITLEPFEGGAWAPWSTILTLKAWAAVPGRVMVLSLRGTNRDVIFRHQDGEAVSATPLVHFTDVQAADWYLPTLKLMEV